MVSTLNRMRFLCPNKVGKAISSRVNHVGSKGIAWIFQYVGENKTPPIIIATDLKEWQVETHISILQKYKRVID